MIEKQLTFIDWFAGIGGFRRGMELAGHKCVGFCEFDKFAVASYTSMHLITEEQRQYLTTLPLKQRQKEILKDEYKNDEWYANDITRVCATDIPRADCWCFGAPCQSFSVAGKREGLNGESGLVREIFRLLNDIPEEDRPRWLIYENVKGMFSSNRGWDYAAILVEMDSLGYDIEWQNINSKDYVPQNRERIFTIGHLRGRCPGEVFPVEGASGQNSIHLIGHRDGYRRNTQVFSPDGITEALDTATGGGRGHHIGIKINPPAFCDMNKRARLKLTNTARTLQARYNKGINNHKGEISGVAIPIEINCINIKDKNMKERPQQDRIYAQDGIMTSLNSQLGGRHNIAVPVKEAVREGYTMAHEGDSINLPMPNSKTRRGRVGHEVAQTLDTSCNQGILVRVKDDFTVYAVWNEEYQCYIAIRRLTPRECFRLQGWEDEYFDRAEFVNSDSQLYRQAGNGVTVSVIQAIAERIGKVDDTH